MVREHERGESIYQDRDAMARALLAAHFPLAADARVLDLGCGGGHELVKWRDLVAEKNLCGIDLLPERVTRGRAAFSALSLVCGDGTHLPFASRTFHLVMQFTVFTSILDPALKQRLAAEMLRVLEPRGAILWYDYWWNPTNPQTRGITRREIRQLFPECSLRVQRVTLAPPLARWLAPRSLKMCAWLNHLPFLRSHYLALLTRA